MKNLCVAEKYNDKVKWNQIGVIFESKGKEYVKLFHMPNVLISVFDNTKKEDSDSGEF